MIKKAVILLILLSCKATQPTAIFQLRSSLTYTPYSINWVSKNELFVLNYKVQKSKNNKNWVTVATISPKSMSDSNVYSYSLQKTSVAYYYKVLANCTKGTFNTASFFLANTLK